MKSTIGARVVTALGLALAVAALAVAAGGCGEDGVALVDLPAARAGAICDRLVRCGEYASPDVCVRDQLAIADVTQVTADVERGVTSYDPGAARACVDAIARASCDDTSRDRVVVLAACAAILRGHVPAGAACSAHDQCESGSCDPGPAGCGQACCAGTCAAGPATPAAIGESCATAPCAEGAYCEAGTCVAMVAVGQPCVPGACTYGTSCSGAIAPTCVETPGPGDPCLLDGGDGTCPSIGLVCDATHRCVRRRREGQSCDLDLQPCVQDFPCLVSSGLCAPLPTLGELCNSRCAGDAYCKRPPFAINGVCVALGGPGDPCAVASECASGACDPTRQVCVDPVACD